VVVSSPKGQRGPRPKVQIPAPSAGTAQDSPDAAAKPVSPFSPLDGHQPVSDWGEEMEMQSPRSSMGGESPPKPASAESSPPQAQSRAGPDPPEASPVPCPPPNLQEELDSLAGRRGEGLKYDSDH